MVAVDSISILGSGWLGLPLVAHFAERGYRVRASTRSPRRLDQLRAAGGEAFVVDIDGSLDLAPEFLRSKILIVDIPSKNVAAFASLVEAIATSPVERVLYTSSTSVYENRNAMVTEDEHTESAGSPLLAIENLFRSAAGFETTIVRLAGLVGYSRHPGRFFGPGKPIPNPDAPVNLVHRDDCVGVISRIVERKAWGEVFNCCADEHPRKRDFYTRAARLLERDDPPCAAPGTGEYKIVSNDKVKRALDYAFVYPDPMTMALGEADDLA